MRALVSESVGIGVSAAVIHWKAKGWAGLDLVHVDAVIDDHPELLGAFDPVSGQFRRRMRPDLLFPVPGGQLAVESKGRSLSRVPQSAPNKDERPAIGRLAAWANYPARQPTSWSVVWTWLGETETQVDLFDPGEAANVVPPASLERAISNRASRLFSSAPSADEAGVGDGDVVLRGSWIDIPDLGELSLEQEPVRRNEVPDGRRHVFLGVLSGVQPPVDRRHDEVGNLSSGGRFVVAVRHVSGDEPLPTVQGVADAFRRSRDT